MTELGQLSLQLKIYERKVNGRTLRERALLCLAVGSVIFMLWLMMVHEPMRNQAQEMAKSLKQSEQKLALAKEEIDMLEKMPKDKRLVDTEQKIEALSSQLARIEQDIAAHSRTFVQPKEMAKMMRRLVSSSNVTLVQMNTLKLPIIEPEDEESEATDTPVKALKQPQFYEFPLELEVEGEFFELADFLASVEQLPWRIFWDKLQYEVVAFPKARLKLRVHTLGPEKHWLGV